MDARAQRTRTLLCATILDLATEQEISQISVAQIARAAQINRVTFYSHATSPMDLLAQALREQLDQVRRHLLTGASASSGAKTAGPGHPAPRPIEELAAHLIAHQAVYRRNITAAGHGTVADFLSEHFAHSVHQVISEHSERIATEIGSGLSLSPTALNATAQFISHGAIGVIGVWLHDGSELDPQRLVTYLDHLFPPWWLAIADGDASAA